MDNATSAEKRYIKYCKKTSKRCLVVVTNKYPENQDVFNSSRLSGGMKFYIGTIWYKEKEKSYITGDSHLNSTIRKAKIKEATPNNRIYVKSFSGATTNRPDYYVVPVLVNVIII